jgi:hypothetical protein
MARRTTNLVTARLDAALKKQFVQCTALNRQSISLALRQAIRGSIQARKAALERDGAEIRANVEGEADVLNCIAAHGVADGN